MYWPMTSSWVRGIVVVLLRVIVGGPDVGVGVVGVIVDSLLLPAVVEVVAAGAVELEWPAAIRRVFSTTLDAYWSSERLTASSRIFCVTVALSAGDPCSRICWITQLPH